MRTLSLALRSLWNRRATSLLTISAIGVSVALLLGVQMVRSAAQEGFLNTLSGVDLIVGARTGPINLLLYSVFRIGAATSEVSWKSYQLIAHHPDVAWTIPLSLGDSLHGFPVLGTDAGYFQHYRFAGDQSLKFSTGGPFHDLYDAVLGADVAQKLHYQLGDAIILSHGLGAVSFLQHKDKPFRVVGILARTGTPVDRTVHISLKGISAMHIDWRNGYEAPPGERVSAEQARRMDLTPDGVTAFLVRMRSPVMTFTMQRAINTYDKEPLLAILPGVALSQLWSLVGIANTALTVVAAFVVVAGLLGMLTAILTSLNERRREMAILRSVGAGARHVFGLMVFEAGLLSVAGVILGAGLTYALLIATRPILHSRFGIFIELHALSGTEVAILCAVVIAALLMGLVPAARAYRNTLSDGLQLRV
ncbi:MAG: ABC transporter permease, partial [Steroidobacteraceae bacterium]